MGFHHLRLTMSLIVTTHQLRTYSDPGSKCSIATNHSNPASAGSQVSAQFSTTSPKQTRFQPVRSKSGSAAQAGLGLNDAGTTDDTDFTDSVGLRHGGW
jgi:hypothetical protein